MENIDDEMPQSMGMGVLKDPGTSFVQKFRWTMKSQNLHKEWVNFVAIDFVNKIIDLKLIEGRLIDENEVNVQRWLEMDLKDERLEFTTFTGCGDRIYRYEFSNLSLLQDKCDFDYAKSDISFRDVQLKYGSCQRFVHPNLVKRILST